MKTVSQIFGNNAPHWVGDGFPVRSLFSYQNDPAAISPFLLLDYAGPHDFAPSSGVPRGVGQHPHRGFETVTIVYDGEVSHRDSSGSGGTIGPGDVQWMTAGSGIIHEEFHSPGFTKAGGPLRMVQLWVNLPAVDKGAAPAYQSITSADIPHASLGDGTLRVIAGEFGGQQGPARTFTPINVWDVQLNADAIADLPIPAGHNALVTVLSGHISIGPDDVGEAEVARLSTEGENAMIKANGDARLLVLTGESIDEPVAGYGPFVMNTPGEIKAAIADFNNGRFGALAQA